MRSLALALLATAALAATLPAQEEGDRSVGMSVVVDHPVQRVYRRAIDAMRAVGYTPRIMLLDEALVTPDPAVVGMGKTPTVAQVSFEEKGDSTRVIVQVIPVDVERQARCTTDACGADAMGGAVMLIGAIGAALDSVKPEPRTAADSLREAKAYGYAAENPLRVGGGRQSGVGNQHAFLRSLRGPGGEAVSYFRVGSCCPFTAPGETQALARIDAYEVTYPGLPKPVLLYFDIYHDADRGPAPAGFTRAPDAAGPST